MKILALILSCVLFSQSLSVCKPSFLTIIEKSEIPNCNFQNTSYSQNAKHSCCIKKNKKNDKENHKKGCCGDGCTCCSHSSIFILNIPVENGAESFSKPRKEKTIFPLFVHSYDFHATVSYPPQA